MPQIVSIGTMLNEDEVDTTSTSAIRVALLESPFINFPITFHLLILHTLSSREQSYFFVRLLEFGDFSTREP